MKLSLLPKARSCSRWFIVDQVYVIEGEETITPQSTLVYLEGQIGQLRELRPPSRTGTHRRRNNFVRASTFRMWTTFKFPTDSSRSQPVDLVNRWTGKWESRTRLLPRVVTVQQATD